MAATSVIAAPTATKIPKYSKNTLIAASRLGNNGLFLHWRTATASSVRVSDGHQVTAQLAADAIADLLKNLLHSPQPAGAANLFLRHQSETLIDIASQIHEAS